MCSPSSKVWFSSSLFPLCVVSCSQSHDFPRAERNRFLNDCLKATATPETPEVRKVQNQVWAECELPEDSWEDLAAASPSFWWPLTTLHVPGLWTHHSLLDSIVTWLSSCLMCHLRIYFWVESHLNPEWSHFKICNYIYKNLFFFLSKGTPPPSSACIFEGPLYWCHYSKPWKKLCDSFLKYPVQ